MVSATALVIATIIAFVLFLMAGKRTGAISSSSTSSGNYNQDERRREERDYGALSEISIPDGPDFGARERV